MKESKQSNYKRFLSKRIVWPILLVMIVSFITIPKIITKAGDYRTINILEVEPGNGFILNDITDNTNKIIVKVTKMDMPTFISTVSNIAGNFDGVYIGRYQKSADGVALKGNWDTDAENRYRDYSTPFKYGRGGNTLEGDNLSASANGGDTYYRLKAQSFWQGNLGFVSSEWTTQDQNGNVTTMINGVKKNVVEYYSENDITNRRASEIINMIKSNQLVYVNNGIFNSDLNGSKLQDNFSKYKNSSTYSNFKTVSTLDTNTIISDYVNLSSSQKRPTVTMTSSPTSDTASSTIAQRISNRNMVFKFNLVKSDPNAEYRAKLYLDYDADGQFEDNENDPTTDSGALLDGENTLNFKLDGDFVGYLDWKIEVYKYDASDKNQQNVKTNLYGNVTYKTTSNKVKIRVLQLYSYVGDNLDLSKSNTFDKRFQQDLAKVDDYDVSIERENYDWFNKQTSNYIVNNYDMIILGFADGYGNDDKKNNFNSQGIANFDAFNKLGKSIMFTHDTIALNVLGNSTVTYTDKTKNIVNNATTYLLTQKYRDIVGQSRYKDPYNNQADIVHDPSINDTSSDTITLGATAYSSMVMYDKAMVPKGTCSTVKIANKAQITSYPFNLTNSTIPVERTHVQWYQLNLEDPDLVPWYNLSTEGVAAGNIFNNGDSRNFYYTYSLRNITYSGTGHTSNTTAQGGYTNEELQLFVNTIIKAARGANNPPKITNWSVDKKSEYQNGAQYQTSASTPFSFVTKIYDIDAVANEDMNVTIKTDDNKTLFDGKLKYVLGGVYTDTITLDSAYLSTRIGQYITITVDASDGKGAKAVTKTFQVKVDNTATTIYHGVDKLGKTSTDPVWSMSNLSNLVDQSSLSEPYFTVVPFIAYINMFSTDGTLTLSLDKNFSQNVDTNGGEKRAYTDGTSTYMLPTVYVVKNGVLNPLGVMTTVDNGKTYTFNFTKAIIESNGTKELNANYDIVVRYYGKTYNHDTSNDGSLMTYTNNITVSRTNLADSSLPANINVGYKKLEGILY